MKILAVRGLGRSGQDQAHGLNYCSTNFFLSTSREGTPPNLKAQVSMHVSVFITAIPSMCTHIRSRKKRVQTR